MADSGTGVVSLHSDLKRKKWILEGLLQTKAESFWAGLTGTTDKAVIYQRNDASAKDGHEIHFQFNGNLASEAKVDKEQAWGNSETKKLFSDKLRVRRLRWSVDNGDKFDAVDVGDLSLAEHQDSRAKLADLFIRAKDQLIFDALQGLLHNERPSHRILPNGKKDISQLTSADRFSYDFLLDVEEIIKQGKGYSIGGNRRPLEPYKLQDGQRVWILVVDARVARDIRADDKFIDITSMGDVRGEDNMLIKGVIGKVGSFLIKEAPTAFGKASPDLGKSRVEIAGLRHIDSAGLFEGQAGYGASGTVEASRSLILGKTACQIGFGKQPDYHFKTSQDFDIKSESALEVWLNVQKTILKEENGDYDEAKVTGFDYGVVCVDTFYRTN